MSIREAETEEEVEVVEEATTTAAPPGSSSSSSPEVVVVVEVRWFITFSKLYDILCCFLNRRHQAADC